MQQMFQSTRFLQSVFIQVTGAIALFADKIDGPTYVALSTIALGVYATAEVVQRRGELKAESHAKE